MRLAFTLLILALSTTIGFSQINAASPFPVDFEILSPSGAAGVYDYGTQTEEWGPTVSETVQAEIVWAFNDTDSLGCNPSAIVTDLTDKFALIRRGGCNFSEKVLNAQNAGAVGCIILNHYANPDDTDATVFGMLGGDAAIADLVTIPAVFISRGTGVTLLASLDAGETVTGSFTVKSFYDPISSYSYHTPIGSTQAFDGFQINYINGNQVDADTVTVTATVTSPSGVETALTGSSIIAPLADSVVVIDGSFLPEEVGEYTVTWSNDATDETLDNTFVITDYTFAVDNGTITGGLAPSDDFFLESNLSYTAGGLVLPNADGTIATHASFGIANAAAVYSGDASADQVTIILYDADADDDQVLDFSSTSSFNDLTPVALASYTITGNEGTDELLYVELEDLDDGDNMVNLKPNGAYYITISYDGAAAGLGVAPAFLGTTDVTYNPFLPTTPIVLDQFYGAGWLGSTVVTRLHTTGFVAPVGTEDLVQLEAGKVTIAPNPVQDMLNLTFELDASAEDVQVGIMDVNGKVLNSYEFDQVYNETLQINVSQLPAATYFVAVITPEGVRVEKIVKL